MIGFVYILYYYDLVFTNYLFFSPRWLNFFSFDIRRIKKRWAFFGVMRDVNTGSDVWLCIGSLAITEPSITYAREGNIWPCYICLYIVRFSDSVRS